MQYRSYRASDQARILKIFESNCPKYFDPNDKKYLIEFLENWTNEDYLVVINNGNIIGCGGHYVKEDSFGIAWVMFERESIGHRHLLNTSDQFYGKIEDNIRKENLVLPIKVNTTQLMEKLFNRYGFKTYEIIENGFGDGLDEYKMSKSLY